MCYRTAHLISSYKPRAPILTITRNGQTARQAHLYRGVFPIHYMGMYAYFTTLEPNTPTHTPNYMQCFILILEMDWSCLDQRIRIACSLQIFDTYWFGFQILGPSFDGKGL